VGLHTSESVYDAEVYEDIEVKDFNTLFLREGIIAEQFGQSIRVKVSAVEELVTRIVREDLSLIK
jgi:type VI protein secretion system component VasK